MALPPVGATRFVPPTLSPAAAGPARGAGTPAASFAQGLQQVEQLQSTADSAASGLATGQLYDVHAFTTASAKASLGVELTVALRNRAVDAYQEIMRMQV